MNMQIQMENNWIVRKKVKLMLQRIFEYHSAGNSIIWDSAWDYIFFVRDCIWRLNIRFQQMEIKPEMYRSYHNFKSFDISIQWNDKIYDSPLASRLNM